jgi:hypothetical protein
MMAEICGFEAATTLEELEQFHKKERKDLQGIFLI